MKVYRVRKLVQIFCFFVFIYGAYFGIRLTNFLPSYSATNPTNYSSGSFLIPMQNMQFSMVTYPYKRKANIHGGSGVVSFPDYVQMWGPVKTYLVFFLSLFAFFIVFCKLWCGWMCPFGSFQDAVTGCSKKAGVRQAKFSDGVVKWVSKIKYVMLAVFLTTPVLAIFHLAKGTPLFDRINPARSFLSLFQGNLLNLGIGEPPGVIASIITVIFAGSLLVGIFFRSRLFCYICPIAGFINIFYKLSFLRLGKKVQSCNGCGHCRAMCPVDAKKVWEEKSAKDVFSDNCVLCLKCIESCPVDDTLYLKYLNKKVFYSSRKYFDKLFCRRK